MEALAGAEEGIDDGPGAPDAFAIRAIMDFVLVEWTGGEIGLVSRARFHLPEILSSAGCDATTRAARIYRSESRELR